MLIKGIIDEDFVNYKKPNMYIAFPHCTFKCEKECGINGICQNSPLARTKNIEISTIDLVKRYTDNPITKSVVLAGLEPLDSFEDVIELISELRKISEDDFVIYTGYTEDEVSDKIDLLKQYNNVIVKFGRFRPGHTPHYDETLGISLVSDNQYGKKIS